MASTIDSAVSCRLPTMTVSEIPFAAIDFESAGSAPGLTDEPVQIAVVHWVEGMPSVVLNSYLRPSRPVLWSAREVHGIDDTCLQDAPRLLEIWPQVRHALAGRWVVAHGAATEKRFLRIFPLHGFGPWVDTLTLVRAVYPGLASHALGEAIAALGLAAPLEASPGFRWHDAASDATASLVLLRHLIDSAGIGGEPAKTLASPELRAYFKTRRQSVRPA
jgi:DNA polymerase-3 subunit epsilon